jgi:LPXTG-motif cell wall-anchored protein
MRKTFTGILSLSLALGTVSGVNVMASAAPGDSISLYFSAPFVTGSHVTDGAMTETFNSYSDGPCPTSIPFATVTFTTNSCNIDATAGTSPGSSEPAIGVPASGYVWPNAGSGSTTTYTFSTPVKYVGFYWFSGSDGNKVEFLDSNNSVIATLNSIDIINFLGSNSLVSNSDTRTLNAVDGRTYLKRHYYRTPANYTGTVSSPVMDYSVSPWANEPWAYLNLFVTGSVDVTKVRFTGAGFEYDNLTISTQESGPRGDMVLIRNVLNTPPAAQVVAWDPTNTSDSGTNAIHTPSQAATKTTPNTGGGAISYSVVDAGNSGCTVNSSTGVITRTGIGNCRVRATAAAVTSTPSYYSAYREVTFSFSSAITTTPTATSTPTTAPASTTPAAKLATTGANLEWLMVAGLLAVVAGSGFLAFSRRKRIW